MKENVSFAGSDEAEVLGRVEPLDRTHLEGRGDRMDLGGLQPTLSADNVEQQLGVGQQIGQHGCHNQLARDKDVSGGGGGVAKVFDHVEEFEFGVCHGLDSLYARLHARDVKNN